MKKETTIYVCDICKHEISTGNLTSVRYPVIFSIDQTEGKPCEPYISYKGLDLCLKCANKALKISGLGAQGNNTYKILEESE